MSDHVRESKIPLESEPSFEASRSNAAPKFLRVAKEEFQAVHLRYLFFQMFVSLLPHNALSRVRTVLYRCAGFKIGKNALILGKLTVTSDRPVASMISIGSDSRINSPFYAEANAPITIGRSVGIGHHAVLITTDHDTGESGNRSGKVRHSPIVIEDGAWIGASVTILPGVTIGNGSVVAAGSLVSQSVPANRVVGGVPARPVKTLDS